MILQVNRPEILLPNYKHSLLVSVWDAASKSRIHNTAILILTNQSQFICGKRLIVTFSDFPDQSDPFCPVWRDRTFCPGTSFVLPSFVLPIIWLINHLSYCYCLSYRIENQSFVLLLTFVLPNVNISTNFWLKIYQSFLIVADSSLAPVGKHA